LILKGFDEDVYTIIGLLNLDHRPAFCSFLIFGIMEDRQNPKTQ
jgi:hypothetical protein